MKLPKRINEALNKRQDYIDSARDKLERTVVKRQSAFLNEVITDVLSRLDVDKSGNILDTKHNYRILSSVERVFTSFNAITTNIVSEQFILTSFGLVDLGKNYFAVALSRNLPQRFDAAVEATSVKMNLRIGLDGGKIVRGGFLDSFLKDNTISTQVKNYISKSITGQIDNKEFIRGLTKLINGDEGPGLMEKQYQRFAYDLYQQYDAAYNSSLAEEFGMNYFVYQGGLIGDSRDFCVAHNAKVWSREESAEWDTWKPYMGEYPEGYEIKTKNIYDIPSYLGYPGYQPLIDRGGYNCRHSLSWISDDLAFELRPELKNV